jgi:low temperature requirement protein LtrA
MTDAEPPPDGDQPLRVSTLELFFDLVFVFAITQLTGILARDMTLRGGRDGERGRRDRPADPDRGGGVGG